MYGDSTNSWCYLLNRFNNNINNMVNMNHDDKHYLMNLNSIFNEGDKIIFEMPSFCSGDYSATVLKDENGLFIPKSDNFFKGCRTFEIIPKGTK